MNLSRKVVLSTTLSILLSSQLFAQNFSAGGGSLEDAIKEISKQSNMTYMVDSRILEGKKAPNIKNIEGVQNALDAILKENDLYAILKEDTIVIMQKIERTRDNTTLDSIQVVTTASGFEQNIADAPASISVITGEELQKKAYRDVNDAVKNIPGIFVSGSANKQEINIRGMSFLYTKFLINGKPVSQGRNIWSNTGNYGNVSNYLPPIEMIERIEVVRGPMSSLYGSDAMGGVINIITKKSSSNTWKGGISPEYTKSGNDISNDEYGVSMYLTGPLIKDKLSLSLDGNFQGNDESDFLNGKEERKVRKIGSELTWNINEQNDLSLKYGYTKQDYTTTSGKSSTASSYSKIEKSDYLVSHNGQFNDFITNTYYQREDIKTVFNKGPIEESIDTFNTQSSYSIGNHILTFGGEYKIEELNNANNWNPVGSNTADRWEMALFLEDEWAMTDNFALTTGIRYINDEVFGSFFTPRLYGVYHLTDNWTIKGGISTGYKQPRIAQTLENFGQGTGGGGSPAAHPRALLLGSEDLDPERSISYEAGLNYSNDDIGLYSSLMLFQTDFKDKIQVRDICRTEASNVTTNRNNPSAWNCSYGPNKYYFLQTSENIDKAEIKGLEFSFDYDLFENLTANTSYTYTKSEQKSGNFKGKPLNDISKNMVNIGLDWDISKDWNTWTIYNYRGKKSGSNNNIGQPGYGTFDAGVIYKATKDMSLKAGVYNIANKEITTADYGQLLDGRRYTVGMNLKF
ncbi:TonB-dependent receptor domain-containing protein [Aliarcobacter lanthieri]|uniref:TonB-dependent receptor domain-containing protein n=1 Tax=Aliarcobacter lanthieri TaxID=1355374 RepID=UPI003AAF3E9C